MKKSLTLILLSVTTLSGFALNVSQTDKGRKSQMKAFGGVIEDRRNQKGCVMVVNGQKVLKVKDIVAATENFTRETCVDVKIEEGSFNIESPKLTSGATLFIVDDAKLPMSLFAPESSWGVVNVAKLNNGKEAFLKSRFNKECFRILAYLCGAGSSQYENCITGCILKPEDLDEMAEISMPLEYNIRFEGYLSKLGVTPFKRVTYQKACREGWAPAPTNEFQQAIWDKVHAIPEKPLKITYDKDKQKPVVK